MRSLIYYVASTVDGFIGLPDGSVDSFPWNEGYIAELVTFAPETIPAHLHEVMGTQVEANQRFDAVLMGRKTYALAPEGVTSPYPTLEQYVFSRTMTAPPDPQVELVSDGAVEVVEGLKQQAGKAIWLCGGANLAATLFSAGLIDELVVKLNPVLFGAGIPLLSGAIPRTALELTDVKRHDSGHLRLHYRVQPDG